MINEPEFWEAAFNEKQEMWGFEPANSAVLAAKLFKAKGFRDILIPGIGYGRNAKVFTDAGMQVAGIEISRTAIEMAARHYGDAMRIHHGSVTDMPFDDALYDGIFCHGLIHLLNFRERKKLIRDCYDQLKRGGCMIFSMVAKHAKTYGQGKLLSRDRYRQHGGVILFFYDEAAIAAEFGKYGLTEVKPVDENLAFYLVVCRKQ